MVKLCSKHSLLQQDLIDWFWRFIIQSFDKTSRDFLDVTLQLVTWLDVTLFSSTSRDLAGCQIILMTWLDVPWLGWTSHYSHDLTQRPATWLDFTFFWWLDSTSCDLAGCHWWLDSMSRDLAGRLVILSTILDVAWLLLFILGGSNDAAEDAKCKHCKSCGCALLSVPTITSRSDHA